MEEVALEDARRQLEVNFFAAAELIRAVLPGMREAKRGRIVNVSSVAGRVGFPLFGWYCASKFALEGLSDALRLEAAPFGISVSLVEPGPVATEFFDVAKRKAEQVRSNDQSPYAAMLSRTEQVGDDFQKQAVPAERVAAVILQAATAASPRARYPVGMMAKGLMLALRLLPRGMIDSSMRKQFRMPKRLA